MHKLVMGEGWPTDWEIGMLSLFFNRNIIYLQAMVNA